MRKYIKFNIALLVLVTIVSCSDKRERQYQFMPDMYVAVPYEADAEKGTTGVSSNLKPVSGTIARGVVPYEYADTNADYEKAKSDLTSPLVQDEVSMEKGKKCIPFTVFPVMGKKEMVTDICLKLKSS